jgi:isoleucyl-tRNA synthetase
VGGVRAAAEAAGALLADELNVRTVATSADEAAFCAVSVKPNFQTLRQRCPGKIKEIGPVVQKWGFAEVGRLESGGTIEVVGEQIGLADLILARTPTPGAATASEGAVTVVLDTQLTPELERDGLANEATSLVQQARKNAGLEVSDRIRVVWHSPDAAVQAAIREHAARIAEEVLAVELVEEATASDAERVEINGKPIAFTIARA